LCVDSPIGPITLRAKAEKLVAVEIGKRTKNFGEAEVLKKANSQLANYFAGKLSKFDLPVEVTGTEFQKKVWKEIARLGFGRSISYGEIAKAIGSPRASRAVGAAVGANPVPLIVGCHRVLGSGGKITGYTGGKGIKTKAWMLRHEGIEFLS
ncbi:MAG: methylated-DNA--[protein]-cysteine S-methyltransferase, partial [Actinomycetota bacterium]